MKNNRKQWRYSARKAGINRARWDEWRKNQWGYIRQYRNYNAARSANGYPPTKTSSLDPKPKPHTPTPYYRVVTVRDEKETFIGKGLFLFKRFKDTSYWECIKADQRIGWMVGSVNEEAKTRLIKLKLKFEFSKVIRPLKQTQEVSQEDLDIIGIGKEEQPSVTTHHADFGNKIHSAYRLPEVCLLEQPDMHGQVALA